MNRPALQTLLSILCFISLVALGYGTFKSPTGDKNSPKPSALMLSSFSSSSFQPSKNAKTSPRNNIPKCYLPIETINDRIRRLKARYPKLVHVEQIGVSTALRQPIWGIKISDNASVREDEPRILFTGVHHAREPIGANICLELMESLCHGYSKAVRTRRWVDSSEIWFVPVLNPDGYKYIFDNNLSFPWWRKNLRDNDGDGRFNPLYDGVDLNRNYDFNWIEGGEGKQTSWFYRGITAFSENETRAVMKLAIRENFTLGVSYHSYGESILFPWGNFKRPPDLDLIVDIASKMAAKIRRQSGYGTYSILPLNGLVGQSSIWMYGHLKVIDYIVEVGTDYFPQAKIAPSIIIENLQGAYYLLDRLLGSGINGHVYDSATGKPLRATVTIKRYAADHAKPKQTDKVYGAFYRLLKPGEYTVIFASPGYKSRTRYNVTVEDGQSTPIEIKLVRSRQLSNGHRK